MPFVINTCIVPKKRKATVQLGKTNRNISSHLIQFLNFIMRMKKRIASACFEADIYRYPHKHFAETIKS